MGPNLRRNRMFCQSTTYGTKYRVRQIVYKTTRTDINSRTLQAAVIVSQDFHYLKSTSNINNKFLKYKISIIAWIIRTCKLYFEFHIHAIS